MDKVQRIRKWFALCERKEYDAIAPFVGDGYVWIDHSLGIVARTPAELMKARAEDATWDDQRFTIHRAIEGTDGRLFVQMTVDRTLPPASEWRGVKGTGQRVTQEVIDIFSFDEEGRVVVEELYGDALSLMRQLGALD